LTPGFADDQPFLPSETKALSGNAKALSADKVALSILRQAGKGSFLIFPGTDARFFYLISTKLPKSLVFSIMDMMAVPSKKAKKA